MQKLIIGYKKYTDCNGVLVACYFESTTYFKYTGTYSDVSKEYSW